MTDRLSAKEQISAVALLMLHAVLLPLAASQLELYYPGLLTPAQYNLAYYCISVVLCFVLLWRYLKESFFTLCDRAGRGLTSILLGWALYLVLSWLLAPLFELLGIVGTDPNTQSVADMMTQDRGIIIAVTLILAPIIEESVFRGGIFCGLYGKSRACAYLVSIILFSVYHVWQFAFVSGDIKGLLYAAAYIPAGFVLCRVYERSGSLWAGIIFHASVNAANLSTMGLL